MTEPRLTQQEVDALLVVPREETAPEGAIEAVEVVAYDFRHPTWFVKGRNETLEGSFAEFAGAIQTQLGPRMRIPVDVAMVGVERAVLSEFVEALPVPCAAFPFQLGDPLGGRGILDVGSELACLLLDRAFGGTGDVGDTSRTLTALEQRVLTGLVTPMLDALRDAWRERVVLTPTLEGFENDPQALRSGTRDETVLVASFEVRCGERTGLVSVCMPVASLEAALRPAAPRPRFVASGPKESGGTERHALESHLMRARITIGAQLPVFRVSARVLAGLEPGSVLATPYASDTPVEVRVNGRFRFRATVGRVKRKVSLRVVERLSGSDASFENETGGRPS